MERITKTLNLKEINELFNKNAVYIENCDIFPYELAVELFGEEVASRDTLEGGSDWNCYTDEDFNAVYYLYERGFYNVASRHNIGILSKKAKK